jgi:hypothetical protein
MCTPDTQGKGIFILELNRFSVDRAMALRGMLAGQVASHPPALTNTSVRPSDQLTLLPSPITSHRFSHRITSLHITLHPIA